MDSYENNAIKFQNMHITCTCIAVDGKSVSIMAEMSISRHLTCDVKLYNIPQESKRLFDDKDVLTLQFYENGQYHVVETQYQSHSETQIIAGIVPDEYESCYSVTYYSSVLLYGFDGRKNAACFDGFSMEITEGFELIGVCPYSTSIDESNPLRTTITSVGSIVFSQEVLYSYYIDPIIIRNKEGLQLFSHTTINCSPLVSMQLNEIKETVLNILLFLEVLCGEIITANTVRLSTADQTVDYIGIQNFFRQELSCLQNGVDTRSHLRHALFKVSDFADSLDNILKGFFNLYHEKTLAFKAYQQLLLDDDQNIFTPNYFLKISQMVEGYQRSALCEEEQKEFEKQKKQIIDYLPNQNDKDFITSYTTYNGVNFRKCIKEFTKDALILITEASTSQIHAKTDSLISKIVNDRDLYTHASTRGALTIPEEDLAAICHCYKVFFRMLVLHRLGIHKTLIRKRLSYDRYFTYSLEKMFGLTISSNISTDTGEFDKEMYGYD